MVKLDIGAGPSSDYEYQIDQIKFPKTTHVLDVAVEPLPFDDNFFDEVRASQVIEHIPVVVYWKEEGQFHKRYCRIELFKEVYRVLAPGLGL